MLGFNWLLQGKKELKKWRREKKLTLIREMNPSFTFLNNEFD